MANLTTAAVDVVSSTLAPVVLAALNETIGNVSQEGGGHAAHTEGGFLSGRNPFVFVPEAPLPTISIQLVVVICMSRIIKFLLSPLQQPSVIAEIISGILLGPSCFGYIPGFTDFVFPKESLSYLGFMSNFGMVLYLFLVGLELDPSMLKKSLKTSLVISIAGMTLPFILGCGTSYILFEYVEPEEHRKNFFSYLLFLGVAMAITAFPVLARILTELNLLKTKVGSITIAASAVDDVTSWCLLALVVSILNATDNMQAIYVFLMGLGYCLFLIIAVRPILVVCLRRAGAFDHETPPQCATFAVLMIVIISSFITDAIGIHAIFGGFVAGIIVPHKKAFAYHISSKLEDIVQIIFLPLYFALSGLKTRVLTLIDPLSIAVLALIILVACVGKIVGCTLAARVTRLTWRESFAVGTLMNCKGLVELIVLNLGFDAGVISDRTFAIMVLMALATTFLTVPLVNATFPPSFRVEYKPSPKKNKDPTLMLSVNRVEQVGPILSVVNLLQQQKMVSEQNHNRKGSNTSSNSNDNSFNTDPSSEVLKVNNSLTSLALADMISLIPTVKTYRKSSQHPSININVLRLIELTERDSSVMLSANETALSNDPVTRLVKTFCEVTNKHNNVECFVKVVTRQMFGKVMAQTGAEMGADYILVPWSGSGSIEEETGSPRRSHAVPRRRHSVHTPVQHCSFLQDLMAEARSSVLIYVDRGGPTVLTADMIKLTGEADALAQLPEVNKKQVWLPFFGGPDDREALNIVLGLRHLHTVRINIIRYIAVAKNGRREVVSDELDENILRTYFGTRKESNESGHSTNQASREEETNFSEVETRSPVTTCVETFARLGGSDLIICGKRNFKMGERKGVSYGNGSEDGERRKVLGDLAEALMMCQCPASVLVVHAVQNNSTTPENV